MESIEMKEMSMRHFTMSMKCTTQHKQGIILKREKQPWKTCIVGIILTKTNQTHSTNSSKYTQSIFEHHIFKTQQKLKIQENKGYKYDILWENKKTHTLVLKIDEEMMKKVEV